MKFSQVAILVSVSVLLAFTGYAQTQSNLPTTVTDVRYGTCPVMGGKVNPDISLIHEGKVYHFCCAGCLKPFLKDPAKYIAKLKNVEEIPLLVNNKEGKCPVMGGQAKVDLYKIQGDTITFFCCPSCSSKVTAKKVKTSGSPD